MKSSRLLAVAACALLLSLPASAAEFDPVSWKLGGLRGVLVGPSTPENPFQSEGTTVKLKDGTLLHAFNLRYGEKDMSQWHPHYARTVIAKVLSHDGGKTWSAPEVLFESNTGINASHPAIRRLANGELGATYQRINTKPLDQWNRKEWLTAVATANKVFRYSADEGKTWSSEIVISPPGGGYWTSAHDRLLVLSSGRLLQPLHSHVDMNPARVATRVAWSDDNGRSWKVSTEWLEVHDLPPGYTGDRLSNFHEVAIVERADQSIFMIGRTSSGRLYWSESRDHGETWAKPAPTSILSPESPANIATVPGTGDILLLWNSRCVDAGNLHVGQRLTLASMLSSDGGATWHDYRELVTIPPNTDNPKHFGFDRVCYPSIFFDGELCHIGYWAGAKVDGQQYDQEYMAAVPTSFFYGLQNRHRPESVKPTL